MQDGKPGERFGNTYMIGFAVDGLFHFTRWERLDPYLAVGAAAIYYGDKINGENFDPSIRGGGGVMWHFNDEWAVRADFRTFLAGNDVQANSMIDAGVVWNWGARVPPKLIATGGPLDSDRDGLTDADEAIYKTNPYDPDTDRDGLKDGEEVHKYTTDPLNPDTDADLLKDGEEVAKYTTDPLDADTDDGGVIDGHEVLEDGTDPTAGHGSDDLVLYELYIQFEYDKAIIKSEYYPQLNVIGKVLSRHPGSTARIEGHCDQFKSKKHTSQAEYNKKLSKDRAKAVVEYIAKNCQVKDGRMTAHGYGFERPKDPKKVDLVNGNPENRRVEIYLKGVGKTKAQLETEGYVIPAVDPVPPKPEPEGK
jgi:outer membrane protein OmpA-like peptidoglycan-associated protein